MPQTAVQIRMEKELWEGMKKTCAKLQMSTDDAFSLFAEKMLSEGRLPFDVPEDPFSLRRTRATSGKASKGLSPGSAGSTSCLMADHRTARSGSTQQYGKNRLRGAAQEIYGETCNEPYPD